MLIEGRPRDRRRADLRRPWPSEASRRPASSFRPASTTRPAILQRSGIGPEALLRRLGIEMVADLPASAETSPTIPAVPFFFRPTASRRPTGRLFAANWRGPARRTANPGGRPIRSRRRGGGHLRPVVTYLCRQEFLGNGRDRRRTDPRQPPLIDHDYLGGARDLAQLRRCLGGEPRALLATAPFAERGARCLDPEPGLARRICKANARIGPPPERHLPHGRAIRGASVVDPTPSGARGRRPHGRRFEHLPRHRHAQHQPHLLRDRRRAADIRGAA